MAAHLNIQVDSPTDQAIIKMVEHLIRLSKSDYHKAYEHWTWCHDHVLGSQAEKFAHQGLERASKFFYGDLFCTVSPVVGDEYVEYLHREIEEGRIDQFDPPEEPD